MESEISADMDDTQLMQAFQNKNITSTQLRKIADMLDEEEKIFDESSKPQWLDSQDTDLLMIPDFDYLRK